MIASPPSSARRAAANPPSCAAQPDERHHPVGPRDRPDRARRPGHQRAAMDVVQLRARVGMVFQKPNPFPKSIFENVAYGPRIHGLGSSKAELDEIVEKSLKRAGLWDEVKDRLSESGTALVRRPAAAAVHRPGHRRRPGSDPDGRALLGARPDRHRQDRGTDPRAARPLRDRHRHAQHAAGRARLAAHRLLPPRRADRVRQDQRDLHQSDEQRTQDYITGRYG